MSTPRTDKHQEQMEVECLDIQLSETYYFARDLERELATATVENTEMREVIKAIYHDTEGYADGAPDASDHDRLCNEISSKLQPYLK